MAKPQIADDKTGIKGVIVADSEALKIIVAPYDARNDVARGSPLAVLNDAKRSDSYNYLDLLLLLSRQGWEVHIPAMPVKEVASMLVDGMEIGNYLPHNRHFADQSDLQAFIRLIVADIAKEARGEAREFPNIHLDTARPGTHYGDYLAELEEAVHRCTGRGKQAQNVMRDAQRKVMNLMQRNTDDYGEDHCIDIIKDIIGDRRYADKPIFFLSADGGARDKLCDVAAGEDWSGRVGVLTANGFIHALCADRAGDDGPSAIDLLGLPGSIDEHWGKMMRWYLQFHEQKRPREPLSDDGYHDAPLGHYGSGRYPFAEAISGLAAELKAKRAEVQAGAEAGGAAGNGALAGGGRSAAFRAKYGSRYNRGAGSPDSGKH